MSLINDALKRVKTAQQQAAPSASVGPQLKPVEPPPPVRQGVNLLLPGALAVVALLALLLVWVVRNKSQANTDTSVRAHVPTAAIPGSADTAIPASPSSTPASLVRASSNDPGTAAPVKGTVHEAMRGPAADSPKTPVLTNDPASAQGGPAESKTLSPQVALASSAPNSGSLSNAPAASIAASNAVAQTEPPKLAPLKLQGITYDRRRPSAVINGRTLFIGDRIRDMRVVSIQPDSATLTGQGSTNVLSLAE